MRLFVDTCVWRYWLTLKNSILFDKSDFEKHAEDFDKIYEIVSFEPLKYVFLYDARVEGELPDCYLSDHKMAFSQIKENSFCKKVPIPLSRADGTYKLDGSLLGGGKFGGVLRDMLSMDGYDHEKAFQTAVPNIKLENPAHTKPRKKEFDIEHLESALEADADLFITADQPLIDRLNRAHGLFTDNLAVKRAYEICVTPSQALNIVLQSRSR